jgi:hypothetical protein
MDWALSWLQLTWQDYIASSRLLYCPCSKGHPRSRLDGPQTAAYSIGSAHRRPACSRRPPAPTLFFPDASLRRVLGFTADRVVVRLGSMFAYPTTRSVALRPNYRVAAALLPSAPQRVDQLFTCQRHQRQPALLVRSDQRPAPPPALPLRAVQDLATRSVAALDFVRPSNNSS